MNQKIKILHLEDLPTDAELIARQLKKGKINCEILVVDNKDKFVTALKDYFPDVIISDHSLPSLDSHEALRLAKAMGVTVPFILVTATTTEEFAATIMKEGAEDYIIKDRLGRLPSAIVNCIEKHRLEAKEQAAHERLVFHIENTPLGFIEWDSNGLAKSWSKRAEEIFGWSGQEFMERQEKGLSHIYEEDIPWVSKIFEQLINGEVERNKMQHRSATKSGKLIWCEWFNSVSKEKNGKVKMIMSLVADITEQKLLERQKDDFLSMASHELKTPVTTIKAYGQIAESMLEKKGDVEILGMIKKMSTQVNKLTNLIEDLLDITKIQNGKLTFNESFFDFESLVKEVVDDMQKLSPTHEIKNSAAANAQIFGDRNKLSQVLNNMISNAIKYSPAAGSIVLSTELQTDGIVLSVQDFGIGILSQDKQNVFEQFFRVKGDNQSTFPGMGIGLYICSEIMKRQGGKMWVESIIGQGSIFYMRLPFDHRNQITMFPS